MFSGWEIMLVVAVIVMLFGASRLPKLAKSLGESRRAFKEGMEEAEKEFKMEDEDKKLDAPGTPQISAVSDEELTAEMQRRAEANQ